MIIISPFNDCYHLSIAPEVPVTIEIKTYSLSKTNEALNELRNGNIPGAAVLVMSYFFLAGEQGILSGFYINELLAGASR